MNDDSFILRREHQKSIDKTIFAAFLFLKGGEEYEEKQTEIYANH